MGYSIRDNAAVVLSALAEVPVDPNGFSYIGGPELQTLTELSPHEINEAISLLEDADLVETRRTSGTAPFDFNKVQITPTGKYEYQESLREDEEKEQSEQQKDNTVFISHISEEKSIALVLKDWIETTFLGKLDVFVSSDSDSIPAGSRWLDKIEQALGESGILLTLCSPTSLQRPWTNFETGCCWIKKVPILPICHSGQSKADLPAPISSFQALEIENDSFAKDLFKALMKHLDIAKLPRLSYAEMMKEIRSALLTITPAETETENHIQQGSSEVVLSDIETKILHIAMEFESQRMRGDTVEVFAGQLSLSITKTKYYLQRLVDDEYLYDLVAIGSPTRYRLSTKGREYLVENDLI